MLQRGLLKKNWDAYPSKDYEILRIDKAFLSLNRRNLEQVKKEMVSERSSLEEFLNNSFGFAVTCDNEIVSWCMSEYNFVIVVNWV